MLGPMRISLQKSSITHVQRGPNPIVSPMLAAAGFRHAFFTCAGGVSSGPFATLNLSSSVGDSPANVAENLNRAADWLGIGVADLNWVSQTHGSEVVILDGHLPVESVRMTSADAIIASTGNCACCVRTADCVPVLVADRVSGRVAAIHAGWRGVVAGIVPQTIARLTELGTRREHLIAAIGPHIRVDAFEVSDDVSQLIGEATPRVCVVRRDLGDRPHVSLAQSLCEQLKMAGLGHGQVDDVGGCTFQESDRFFSYRRLGRASGRHLHAILPGGS
jgi:YfiH family protein